MSRQRTRGIAALVDIERHQRDRAAGHLADGQQMLRERERVLDELCRYREEYAGRRRGAGVQIVAFQDYQRFLARLDEAIARQSQLVSEARRDCEARREAWIAARARAHSLEQAVERGRREQQRLDARREQRRADETASSGLRPQVSGGDLLN